MKENLPNSQFIVAAMNPLQEKISLLSEKGFLWREIAVLIDLPKKLIKGIAKGKFIPNEEECNRLGKLFDEVIKKLSCGGEIYTGASSPETDPDTEGYVCHTIEIKNISLYKVRDDNKIIVQIHGEKLTD